LHLVYRCRPIIAVDHALSHAARLRASSSANTIVGVQMPIPRECRSGCGPPLDSSDNLLVRAAERRAASTKR